MKIGITLSISKENESMWINGIKQNAIYLMKVLKMSGFDVVLVETRKNIMPPYEGKVVWDLEEYPMQNFEDCYKELDVLFFLGATLTEQNITAFKSYGEHKRVIKYACGNNYTHDLERSVFNSMPDIKSQTYPKNIDEVWYVPQQGNTNHEYWRAFYKLDADKVRPIPFIWDPMFLDKSFDSYAILAAEAKKSNPDVKIDMPIYVPGKALKDKKIAVMEPNINTFKWSMIPTLIVDDYYHQGGEFNVYNVIGGKHLLKNEYFISLVKQLDIYKDGKDPKIQFYSRTAVHAVFAKAADVIVSHQWENPLNYAYLDALYLQFPLVHNADMVKDGGYYYPGFNVNAGRKQLKRAMAHHDKNIDEYNERSEAVLNRYIASEEMANVYKALVENAVEPGKHQIGSIYNWKTNMYS